MEFPAGANPFGDPWTVPSGDKDGALEDSAELGTGSQVIH